MASPPSGIARVVGSCCTAWSPYAAFKGEASAHPVLEPCCSAALQLPAIPALDQGNSSALPLLTEVHSLDRGGAESDEILGGDSSVLHYSTPVVILAVQLSGCAVLSCCVAAGHCPGLFCVAVCVPLFV